MSDNKPTFEPLQCWAFAWVKPKGKPWITRLTGYQRRELIKEVEDFLGIPWRRIRNQGGRAIKVTINER